MHPLHVTTRQEKIDWLKRRRLSIGASDIPIIMGLSPYKTIQQLLDDKTSTDEPELELSWPALNGITEEPYIRDRFNEQAGVVYEPKSFKHKFNEHWTCSMDGWHDPSQTGIEIKNAAKKDHDVAIAGRVPDKYIHQLNWQYIVTRASGIKYVSNRYGTTDEPLAIVEVPQPSIDVINNLTEQAHAFWKLVLARRSMQR